MYDSDAVRAVQRLHAGLLGEDSWRRRPDQQLRLLAARLGEGHRLGAQGAVVELANWHPRLVGRPAQAITAADLGEDDFLLTVAREHGYADWAAVRGDDQMPSPRFEAAVEAVVDGALAHLQAALRDEPGLVAARSHWGHRATLLHYVAANGVEIHRQRVPAEAVAIARTLLDHGADPTATAPMYGRQQTTLGLLRSSGHPHAAGLTDPLAALLRDAGG